jgi:hypothetical protein
MRRDEFFPGMAVSFRKERNDVPKGISFEPGCSKL